MPPAKGTRGAAAGASKATPTETPRAATQAKATSDAGKNAPPPRGASSATKGPSPPNSRGGKAPKA